MSLTSHRLAPHRLIHRITLAGAILVCASANTTAQKEKQVSIWLTDPAQSIFFQEQPGMESLEKGNAFPTDPTITIDEKKRFQQIDGFGFALTGGSAQHIMTMSAAARAALLQDLFTTDSTHIGASYLRVSIGASDLNDHVFSYDDLPAGQTDTTLAHFDLGPDKQDVVPVLQEIVRL